MDQLSLPACTLALRKHKARSYIFDRLRRRYVPLTGEEWVRQHLVHYLIHQLGYAKSLMRTEVNPHAPHARTRADVIAYTPLGAPLLLVECKAAGFALKQAHLLQVGAYNRTCQAPLLLASNGKEHLCCHIDWHHKEKHFLSYIPSFEEALHLKDHPLPHESR